MTQLNPLVLLPNSPTAPHSPLKTIPTRGVIPISEKEERQPPPKQQAEQASPEEEGEDGITHIDIEV